MLNVLKFGGTSVGHPKRILEIADIVRKYYTGKKHRTSIVVSAFSGITDQLIKTSELASKANVNYKLHLKEIEKRHTDALNFLVKTNNKDHKKHLLQQFTDLENLLTGIFMLKELSPRSKALVQSFGERSSAYIIAAYFNSIGLKAQFIDARNWIKTDDNFAAAGVDFNQSNKLIRAYFKSNNAIPIITGFIASNKQGLTTTLGRGGSDYTASIVAAAMKANSLDIWTDVNGVLTTDPRKVSKAFTVDEMSYDEAMEMSHFGAKVIYAPTITPSKNANIPIYIKNTFDPSFIGTKIHRKPIVTNEHGPLRGLSSSEGFTLLTLQGGGMQGVPGIAARMFSSLSNHNINVIMITQASSEQSITVAIKTKDKDQAKKAIEKSFEYEIKRKLINPIETEQDISLVAIIGDNMQHRPGVAGNLFKSLGKNGVNVEAIAQGSSERNISFAIKTKDEVKALNAVHDRFFLSKSKTIHLFIVGVGLIGGTLLEQIKKNFSSVQKQLNLDLKIIGISNSKKMLFDIAGINLKTWKQRVSKSKIKADANQFIQNMIALNLPNSIFVDGTASKEIPLFYKKILSSSISISTPNKIASSSSHKIFNDLKETAISNGVRFVYETNVGAGLPLISSIRSLLMSGDKIQKIEAVLSGSVSYIFNNYDSSRNFHDIVVKAQQLGLTEPDPRDDLSGADVIRKITILSREAGYNMETKNVNLRAILPDVCLKAKSVEHFFKSLKSNNNYFLNKVKAAEKKNKRLRFVATFQNNKASVALKEVDQDHPFYHLKDSNNMVVITSERYKKHPLIIQGPGAGAEVTAAGVFSEILMISNRNIS